MEESLRRFVSCVSGSASLLSHAIAELALHSFDAIVIDTEAERGTEIASALRCDGPIIGVADSLVRDAAKRNAEAPVFLLPAEGERTYSVITGTGSAAATERMDTPPLLEAILRQVE